MHVYLEPAHHGMVGSAGCKGDPSTCRERERSIQLPAPELWLFKNKFASERVAKSFKLPISINSYGGPLQAGSATVSAPEKLI